MTKYTDLFGFLNPEAKSFSVGCKIVPPIPSASMGNIYKYGLIKLTLTLR